MVSAPVPKPIRSHPARVQLLTRSLMSIFFKFVKSSDKTIKRNKKEPIVGILHEANDWKIDSDLPESQRDLNEFVFPFWICSTDLKPDCVYDFLNAKKDLHYS